MNDINNESLPRLYPAYFSLASDVDFKDFCSLRQYLIDSKHFALKMPKTRLLHN